MKPNTPGSRWSGPRGVYAFGAFAFLCIAAMQLYYAFKPIYRVSQLPQPVRNLFTDALRADSDDADLAEMRRNYRFLQLLAAFFCVGCGICCVVSFNFFRGRRGVPLYDVHPESAFCGECGYDHAHLTDSANCPECGLPVGFWQQHTKWPHRLRREVSRLGPHEYARRFGKPNVEVAPTQDSGATGRDTADKRRQ